MVPCRRDELLMVAAMILEPQAPGGEEQCAEEYRQVSMLTM
jgi:hypothetical protein